MGLQQAWLRRDGLARWLWPVSIVYRAVIALRGGAYRMGLLQTQRSSVPVIVVGNVIVGGSGKTPAVIAIVRHLRSHSIEVGVVSRGHGRETVDNRAVQHDSEPREVGDEPALIHRVTGVPVFVARRRPEAVQALLAAHPETQVIVSDDGLQHLAMARDIEICVFDDRGVGNGWLLPAGPLREPWPRPCDLVLHTGSTPAFAGFFSRRSLADHAMRSDGSRVPLDSLGAQPLIAVAAIAKPQAFFDMLRDRGLVLQECIALSDHDDFMQWKSPREGPHTLLCTEKDAVKLWRVAPEALAVPLVFEPAPEFFAALDAKLSSVDGHQAA